MKVITAICAALTVGLVAGCSDPAPTGPEVDGTMSLTIARHVGPAQSTEAGRSVGVVDIVEVGTGVPAAEVLVGPGNAEATVELATGQYELIAREVPCVGSCPTDAREVSAASLLAITCTTRIDALADENVLVAQQLYEGECQLMVELGIASRDYRLEIDPATARPGDIVTTRITGPSVAGVLQGRAATLERREPDGTWREVGYFARSETDGSPRSWLAGGGSGALTADALAGTVPMLALIPNAPPGEYRVSTRIEFGDPGERRWTSVAGVIEIVES